RPTLPPRPELPPEPKHRRSNPPSELLAPDRDTRPARRGSYSEKAARLRAPWLTSITLHAALRHRRGRRFPVLPWSRSFEPRDYIPPSDVVAESLPMRVLSA